MGDVRSGSAADAERARDLELVGAARAVLGRAHCPYSGVRVGAALWSSDGRVHTGCNVENASYGLTLCAERSAVVKAVSEGARAFAVLAIATSLARPLLPCGACRQVLVEFGPDLRVVAAGSASDDFEVTTLALLLPAPFGPASLGLPDLGYGARRERRPEADGS